MKKSPVLLCILFILALGVMSFEARASGTISIDSPTNIQKGSQAIAAVHVSGVPSPGLLSYQVELKFDYLKVQIEEIRPGDSPFNAPVVGGSIQAANQSGTISFGQFLSGSQGLSNGIIANVVLRAIGNSGERSVLELSIAGNSCNCIEVSSGSFSIAYGDCDHDGIPDDQESHNGTNPCDADSDHDGVPDSREITLGTSPTNPDTDHDGLTDGFEAQWICLNPLKADTDFDGLADGQEVNETHTNPCKSDTDSDGIGDKEDKCPLEMGTAPTGCAQGTVGGDPPLYNSIQIFPTPETALGQDLNNNNSIRDTVLRYRDTQTGEVHDTGQSVSGGHASVDVYENTVVFVGGDNAIRYLDIKTGNVSEVGMHGTHPVVYGNIIAFESSGLIYTYNTSSQLLTPTGATGSEPVIYGSLVAYSDGSPATIRYLNLSTGSIVDTKQVGTHPAIYDQMIAFATSERQSNLDLDRNGKIDDYNVIRYYDIASGQVQDTAAVGDYPVLYGSQIAFSTKESSLKQDLNGDGKIAGEVVRFYNTSNSTTYNTKELGTEPDIFQGKISYYVWENWAGKDLNGDGDTSDPILGLFDTRSASAVATTPPPASTVTTPSSGATSIQQFDVNHNNIIDDSEFFSAIDQWVSGTLGNDLFFALVDAWVSGSSMRAASAEQTTLHVSKSVLGSSMTFSVQNTTTSSVHVDVFDLQGKQVFTGQAAGNRLTWHMLDAQGRPLANGVYFYVVTAQNADRTWKSEIKKLGVVR
ncbi:T9SS type A sorting domain-containing protein [Candidatus Acetothermia bacterium]|nr:T9SS type A sorting domain-containing protein [Candidatus Acetothermia bacterium]MBI3642803.1 T9SS type A sorting domain-containing protein [Candidatus Acetothermia bacterium]